jgi:cysteine synthase
VGGVGGRAGRGRRQRIADTHLHVFPLPPAWGVSLYLKDESVHPTGSLKHRSARSLVLYGLCNGWIGQGTTLVEASSGSTAVSEAYFAGLLGLPFVAVMPASRGRPMPSIRDPGAVTCGSPLLHDGQNAEPSGSTTHSRVASLCSRR